MRTIKRLHNEQNKGGQTLSWRSNLIGIVSKALPTVVFQKIMENQFVNFGIETTNVCNADCTFCAYRFMDRPKKVMNGELYQHAIDEYSDCGGGVINFTPTVGDPFVDKNILKKIQYAASKDNIYNIFLYTNGILLNRFGFDEVLNSGINRLAISTYVGSREGYKKYYGKDKYDIVINNIIEIGRLNRKLGNPVLITLHLRVSADEDWKSLSEFKEITSYIDEKNISYLTVYDAWSGRIAQKDLPDGCTIAEPLTVDEKVKSPCFELYRRVHVMADGSVGACVCTDLESEIKIGNLHEQSLSEIWRGKKIREYRKNWLSGDMPEVCKTCTRYTPINDYISENKSLILIHSLIPLLIKLGIMSPKDRKVEGIEE